METFWGRKQNREKAKYRIRHFTKQQNGEFYLLLFQQNGEKAKCRKQ